MYKCIQYSILLYMKICEGGGGRIVGGGIVRGEEICQCEKCPAGGGGEMSGYPQRISLWQGSNA